MLRKRYAALILAATLPGLAGCVQATRHSNTMVFGTNTSLAARVGQGVNQIPEISVGYGRQEAVIMPLLANTQDQGGRKGLLAPCGNQVPNNADTSTVSTLTDPAAGKPHPCKFVAIKKDSKGVTSQDSYSVLASFGANIKARSPSKDNQNAEIGVGIAQYFATGVAAQLLAANGGAAVVSVSQGAKESAKSTKSGKATAAVTGEDIIAGASDDDIREIAEQVVKDYTTFRSDMAKGLSLTTEAKWPDQCKAIASTTVLVNAFCSQTIASLKTRFEDAQDTPLLGEFNMDRARLTPAASLFCRSNSQAPDTDCSKI